MSFKKFNKHQNTICLVALFLAPHIGLKAQLLQNQKEWFGLENFFNKEEIQAKRIKAIHIKIEDKEDGEIIVDKGSFRHYEFNESGLLSKSITGNRLTKGIDTIVNRFLYNESQLLILKEEEYGPFHFSYAYQYSEENMLLAEYKIDLSKEPIDTLNHRVYSYERINDLEFKKQTSNYGGRVYKVESVKENKGGKIVSSKLMFVRGGRKRELFYNYENQRLSSIQKSNKSIKQENSYVKFFYNGDSLDEVKYFSQGEINLKRAFVYRSDGLIEAIVERNFSDESIRIYYFLYEKK